MPNAILAFKGEMWGLLLKVTASGTVLKCTDGQIWIAPIFFRRSHFLMGKWISHFFSALLLNCILLTFCREDCSFLVNNKTSTIIVTSTRLFPCSATFRKFQPMSALSLSQDPPTEFAFTMDGGCNHSLALCQRQGQLLHMTHVQQEGLVRFQWNGWHTWKVDVSYQ